MDLKVPFRCSYFSATNTGSNKGFVNFVSKESNTEGKDQRAMEAGRSGSQVAAQEGSSRSARTCWNDEPRVDAARNQHVLQMGRKPQKHTTQGGARMCVGHSWRGGQGKINVAGVQRPATWPPINKTAQCTAQEVGTCLHDDPEHFASTDELQRVASTLIKVARCARKALMNVSEPASTAHRVSSARPQNQDSTMCCFGCIGQNMDGSGGFVTTSQKSIHLRFLSLASRQWRVRRDPAPEDANDILAHWNKWQKAHGTCDTLDNKKRYSKVGNMFRATLDCYEVADTYKSAA